MKKQTKCLNPKCENKSEVRGLCRSHYVYASLLVRTGNSTWEELEKHGKCLKSYHNRAKYTWLLDFKKGNHE